MRAAQKPKGFHFQKCIFSPHLFLFQPLPSPFSTRDATAVETDPLLPWELVAAYFIPHTSPQVGGITHRPSWPCGKPYSKEDVGPSPPHLFTLPLFRLPPSGLLPHWHLCDLSLSSSSLLYCEVLSPTKQMKTLQLDHLTQNLTRTIGHTWQGWTEARFWCNLNSRPRSSDRIF